jgi:hypothetical protein
MSRSHDSSIRPSALRGATDLPSRRRFLRVVGTLLVADWAAPLGAAEAKVRLAVVVAKGHALSELSIKDLRNLYKGDQINGPDGKRLIPFALPVHSAERVAFDRAVLGMSPDQVASYWIDRKIRGRPGAPKSVATPELLVRVIAGLEGAIGYVRVGNTASVLQTIRINGTSPSDPDYPIEY